MKVIKMACGQTFSVALLDDGTLWGCGLVGVMSGFDFRGKIMTKVKVSSSLRRIKDVAAGFHSLYVVNEKNQLWMVDYDGIHKISEHVVQVEIPLCGEAVFALKDNGEVWAYGDHRFASDNFEEITLPAELTKNVISLAALSNLNLALINGAHNLFVGGHNYDGQLGDGTRNTDDTLKCVLQDIQQVEFGQDGGMANCCFALKRNGQLYGWGRDLGGWGSQKYGIFTDRNNQNVLLDGHVRLLLQPQIILENVIRVTSGFGHTLAISKEGELLSWGENRHGELGDASNENRFDPKVVFSDAKYAKAGNGCSFVVDISGQLWACGSNTSGQLGIGNQEACSSFVGVQFNQ